MTAPASRSSCHGSMPAAARAPTSPTAPSGTPAELEQHRTKAYGRRNGPRSELKSVFVSELCHMPPETPGQHRHLHCGKSLIGSALVRSGMRQHARAESISKRA